eukprot:m.1273772 g.1273772  ORF g.1273772 m.1273772 type:complete len:68 (+) comp24755_c1_seq28:1858-2061(+)
MLLVYARVPFPWCQREDPSGDGDLSDLGGVRAVSGMFHCICGGDGVWGTCAGGPAPMRGAASALGLP